MKKKKRNFSSFGLAEAFKELRITALTEWNFDAPNVMPGEFFHERMRRLKEGFNTTNSERAKELVIEAVCGEALGGHPGLRSWKAATIQDDNLTGAVDYMAAPNRGYLDNPLLCLVEAKKDDFEQGLAQCLVEMKACQQSNEKAGNKIDVYGIVTNGEGWKFYKLDTTGRVFETLLYSLIEVEKLLGALSFVFSQCEKNIQLFTKAA
jgi:hypothetical protein